MIILQKQMQTTNFTIKKNEQVMKLSKDEIEARVARGVELLRVDIIALKQ